MLTFPPKHVSVHCRKCYILASLKDASRLDCPYDLFFSVQNFWFNELFNSLCLPFPASLPPPFLPFSFPPLFLHLIPLPATTHTHTHTHTHARTHAHTHAFSKGNFNECIARAKRARLSKTLYIFYIDEIGITI